jgi:hypothetical protein
MSKCRLRLTRRRLHVTTGLAVVKLEPSRDYASVRPAKGGSGAGS